MRKRTKKLLSRTRISMTRKMEIIKGTTNKRKIKKKPE